MSRYGDDHNAWVKENLFNTACNFLLEVSVSDYETPVECLLGIIGDSIAEIYNKRDEHEKELQRMLNEAHEALKNATAIIKSQPDIVLCKECRWYDQDELMTNYGACTLGGERETRSGDWFCAEGETKYDYTG